MYLKIFDVAALVRGDGDPLHVFLDRAADDFADRPVVAEVDHLGARGLQQAPHDIDRGVVAVEERGRAHQPDVGGAERKAKWEGRSWPYPRSGQARMEAGRRRNRRWRPKVLIAKGDAGRSN